MDSTAPTNSGQTNAPGSVAPASGAPDNNQNTQAEAGAGQTSSTDIKKFEADLFKLLQDQAILEPIPDSIYINYRPVGGRRTGLTLILDPTTVDTSIKHLVTHFVKEGIDGVDKLPENYLDLMGEAFDFCHWAAL